MSLGRTDSRRPGSGNALLSTMTICPMSPEARGWRAKRLWFVLAALSSSWLLPVFSCPVNSSSYGGHSTTPTVLPFNTTSTLSVSCSKRMNVLPVNAGTYFVALEHSLA